MQRFRLVASPAAAAPQPVLDAAQRAVVDHSGGPLLVLAGPGTGKTTTLVEAVAARVERGDPLDALLVLTFSRRAAGELRERLALRLGRVSGAPVAWTFHSFCFALLRFWRDPREPAPRLLTGPMQEAAVRELLLGDREDGGRRWPEPLRPALGTAGFAEEVRDLLSRAREQGLDPAALGRLARAARRRDWSAAAGFYATYLDVLDAQGLLDYGELVSRATVLAESAPVRSALRERYRAVFVDEYQDTDPGQERLLQALGGDGRDCVVVGDPDQAIYRFRGADVGNLLRFPERFPRRGMPMTTLGGHRSAPAPVLSLRTCRRFGPELLAVSRRVAARLGAPGLTAAQLAGHRDLRSAVALGGNAQARCYPSRTAEAQGVAALLREAHLRDDVEWSQMAVLARSAAALPLLARVLSASGVPVELSDAALPLVDAPPVAALLLALRCADEARQLTPERCRELLVGPLIAASPALLRRAARFLRANEPADAPARPGGVLLAAAVREPELRHALPEGVGAPLHTLSALLARCAGLLAQREVDAALWELWQSSGYASRLEAAALGSGADARSADRDIDAVLALFDAVRAAGQRWPGGGARRLLAELAEQEMPAAGPGQRLGQRVRLLTAHRSKGLEWRLVVVAGLCEGVWPDLRPRSDLLGAGQLALAAASGDPAAGAEALRPSPSELLADERRLFYVALTRARERLVLTAVQAEGDGGDAPSRFLAETGLDVQRPDAAGASQLSLEALVAELRCASVDPGVSGALRRAAALRLAELAAARDAAGRPLVPAADPDCWWGLLAPSDAPVNAQDTDGADGGDTGAPSGAAAPVVLSASAVSALQECPLRYFLSRQARAGAPAAAASSLGSAVHALAHAVASGEQAAELEPLVALLDQAWAAMPYEAPWQASVGMQEARDAVERFLGYHHGSGRRLLGSEVTFDVEVALPGTASEHGAALRPALVRLRGSLDRVELSGDGRVVIVDLKTGRTKPTRAEVAAHPQLGVYQLAVHAGALDGMPAAAGRPAGGAELVHLGVSEPSGAAARQEQGPLGDQGVTWAQAAVRRAAEHLLTGDYPARPGEACRRCEFLRCCPAQAEGAGVVA